MLIEKTFRVDAIFSWFHGDVSGFELILKERNATSTEENTPKSRYTRTNVGTEQKRVQTNWSASSVSTTIPKRAFVLRAGCAVFPFLLCIAPSVCAYALLSLTHFLCVCVFFFLRFIWYIQQHSGEFMVCDFFRPSFFSTAHFALKHQCSEWILYARNSHLWMKKNTLI